MHLYFQILFRFLKIISHLKNSLKLIFFRVFLCLFPETTFISDISMESFCELGMKLDESVSVEKAESRQVSIDYEATQEDDDYYIHDDDGNPIRVSLNQI